MFPTGLGACKECGDRCVGDHSRPSTVGVGLKLRERLLKLCQVPSNNCVLRMNVMAYRGAANGCSGSSLSFVAHFNVASGLGPPRLGCAILDSMLAEFVLERPVVTVGGSRRARVGGKRASSAARAGGAPMRGGLPLMAWKLSRN